MQKQGAESERTTSDALRQLAGTPKRVRVLEGKAFLLKPQLSKIEKARDVAILVFDDRLEDGKAPEARVCMLCGKLDSPKRRNATNCDLEFTICKVADAQGDITDLVMGLHRSTLSS